MVRALLWIALSAVIVLTVQGLDIEVTEYIPDEKRDIDPDAVEELDIVETEDPTAVDELDVVELEDPTAVEELDMVKLYGMCPRSHPYAFLDGLRCCATNQERIFIPMEENCDGSKLSFTSWCCNGKADNCLHKRCTDFTGNCPRSHPYAFANGRRCCAKNQEFIHLGMGEHCDGSKLSLRSLCCVGEANQCPHSRCTDFTETNECNPGSSNCHAGASCVRTEHGHTCKCKLGYKGNGRACTKATPTNVALGNQAVVTQSSTWTYCKHTSVKACQAIVAADGKLDDWSATYYDTKAAWWQIDLGKTVPITEIRIYAYINADIYNLKGVEVSLGKDAASLSRIAVLNGAPTKDGQYFRYVIPLQAGTKGRVLKLSKPAGTKKYFIVLREVQVFAFQ